MAPLDGVVAYVSCGQNEQRLALVSRLRGLGAQIAPRLSKDVSHVVFWRIPVPTPEQKTQEDVELKSLFDRARKVRDAALPQAVLSAQCLLALRSPTTTPPTISLPPFPMP
jgi:hypothetical protein